MSSKNEAFYLQYTGTPTQGHEDLIESLTSPDRGRTNTMQPPVKNNTVHINPKFQSQLNSSQFQAAVSGSSSGSPSPTSSPKKGNTVHINPKFANRPLPSVPLRTTLPGYNSRTNVYQNSSAGHVYMNSAAIAAAATTSSEHIYQNIHSSALNQHTTSSAHIYQNANNMINISTTASIPEEPIYSTIGHGFPIDSSKKNEFIQSIQQSLHNQGVATSRQVIRGSNATGQLTVASNGVVLRNKYRKDNRVTHTVPEKPVRNSMIIQRPVRNSVIEKPNRYSLILEKPKRNSVYVVDNRKPVKPARQTIIGKIQESQSESDIVPSSANVATNLSQSNPTPSTSTPLLASVPKSSVASSIITSSTANTSTTISALTTPVRKADEKENLPSAIKKSFLSTPFRKTPFKKIGNRKLIRVKKKSLSPGTPKPSFKRIGNTKLIRIRESLTNDKSSTPSSIYSIKTKTKLVKKVKNTPSNNSKFRFSFITPLSVRKNKIVKQTSFKNLPRQPQTKKNSFTSRFKLDRRGDKKPTRVITKRSSQTRLRKLSNGTYKVSATKLTKMGSTPTSSAPSKPVRTRKFSIYRPKATAVNPNLAPNKVITVQGIKFAVADNGRRLKRLSESELSAAPSSLAYSASVSQSQTSPGLSQTSPGVSTSSPTQTKQSSPGFSNTSPAKLRKRASPTKQTSLNNITKKTYIAGEEFDEIEPGVFTRSRHSLTRQSITQAKARSINTILKVQNRSKQYCMFYNKFGKCTKKEKGSCPYIHDASKIAVCRRFLQGACTKDPCLLSHQLQMDKMPACKYFLEGLCTKENCPYLHVKVNDKAGVCERFLKGFCPNGADCSQRHVIACPEFDRTGACSKGAKCGFPHIQKKSATDEGKKKAPAPSKPKRKSLGTSEQNLKKSRVAGEVGRGTGRYFEQGAAVENNTYESQEITSSPASEAAMADIEERRQRILRKIEQAKMVWRSSMMGEESSSRDNLEASSSTQQDTQDTSGVDTGETGLEDTKDSDSQDQSSSTTGPRPIKRAPLGKLEDFISLDTFASNSNEDEHHNDRLI